MAETGASRGLATLKTLLFDEEAQRLERLSRRIDDVHTHDQKQDERIESIFQRTGTNERLQHSVAQILDGALREAEVQRHEPLSQAIAPLVVRTIKYELKNSQDEMVDALYPLTGRLVKQYVQTAINDLMVEINAKLGGSRKRDILARSASTGLAPNEIAFADANRMQIEELFLVERGSGDLAAHWERPNSDGTSAGTNNRDVLISGYISAIMSFSEEAFGAKPGNMRTLTLGDGERIFVRGSGAFLLAVRAKGTAPAIVETAIDDVFLDSLERYQMVLSAEAINPASTTNAGDRARILQDIASKLEQRLADSQSALIAQGTTPAQPSFARLYTLAAVVLLPLIAWGLWSAFQTYSTYVTRSAVDRVIATSPSLIGYMPSISIDRGGKSYTVSGLLPSNEERTKLFSRFETEVSWARASDRTAVLPALVNGADPMRIAAAEQAIVNLDATTKQTRSTIDPLSAELAGLKDRIANLASEANLTASKIQSIPAEIAEIKKLLSNLSPANTPRAELDAFTRSTAIFFANGSDWRDATRTASDLDTLARRLAVVPDQRIRVVGYTDERGTSTLNFDLAQSRATRVANELISRGVAPERLIVVGRATNKELNRSTGNASANRRVEFELTFIGEPGNQQ